MTASFADTGDELFGSKILHEWPANPVYEYSISMESSESTKVIPVVNKSFLRA